MNHDSNLTLDSSMHYPAVVVDPVEPGLLHVEDCRDVGGRQPVDSDRGVLWLDPGLAVRGCTKGLVLGSENGPKYRVVCLVAEHCLLTSN